MKSINGVDIKPGVVLVFENDMYSCNLIVISIEEEYSICCEIQFEDSDWKNYSVDPMEISISNESIAYMEAYELDII